MSKLQAATVNIHSDLFKAGVTEDGEDYTAEVYYLVAEMEDGTRYAHNAAFPTSQWVVCDHPEGPTGYFTDERDEKWGEVEALLERVGEANNWFDTVHWTRMTPAYGSQAYFEGGSDAAFMPADL